MDDWELVATARNDLADFGESLTPGQWDAQTLCEQWRVRDVFAHVIITASGSMRSILPALLRSGLRPSQALARSAITMGKRTTGAELVDGVRRVAPMRKGPARIAPAGFVADVIVHAQDIRRPLSLPWQYEDQSMWRSLDFSTRAPSMHGIQRRIEGLRLVATDVEWSHGDGPEITAPGEALLMTMWGRAAAVSDLQGPGTPIVASRITG